MAHDHGQSILRIGEMLGVTDEQLAEITRQVQFGEISPVCGPIEVRRVETPETLPIIDQDVTCDDCGACCMAMCSPPFVGKADPEYQQLPSDVRADYDAGMDQREAGGWPDDVPCFWLDQQTRKCKHYEHRPSICRDFDVGTEACLAWRDEFNPVDIAPAE